MSSSDRRPLFLVLVVVTLAGGCARSALVKPHQRQYLADRIMRLDTDRLEKAAGQHVLQTREGALGGNGTTGGGCGCN